MGGAHAAPELDQALQSRPLRSDRTLITDLLYGTLRHLIFLETALRPRLRAPDRLPARVRHGLLLGSYEVLVRGTPIHAAVDQWVETIKSVAPQFAGLANAVLRRITLPRKAKISEQLSLPSWLYDEFTEGLGAEVADRSARAMLEAGPLWLASMRTGAQRRLEAEGCEVRPGPLADTFAVRCPSPLRRLSAFRNGLVQPQNPSSRLPALLLKVSRGERVLDLAGGGGVKAAQLAAQGADVVSVDLDPARLRRAEENFARLGLQARHIQADLTTVPKLAPAMKVLLDAPCSGSGTLRGHPEIKLRLKSQDLPKLARLQSILLSTAAALTSSGGTLVYAVCSLTRAEGPEVVRTLLETAADFEAEPLALPLPHRTTPYGSFLLPEAGLDGFFVARLRRG